MLDLGKMCKDLLPCWKPIIYNNLQPLSQSVESEFENPLVAIMKWLTSGDNLSYEVLIFCQQWQGGHKPAVSNLSLVHIKSVYFPNKHFWLEFFLLLLTYFMGPKNIWDELK